MEAENTEAIRDRCRAAMSYGNVLLDEMGCVGEVDIIHATWVLGEWYVVTVGAESFTMVAEDIEERPEILHETVKRLCLKLADSQTERLRDG